MTRPRLRARLGAALILSTLAVAACGGTSSSSAGASGASGTTTSGASAASGGITVRTAQFTWSAARLTNAVLARIAAAHPELGVAALKTTDLAPAAAWAGAARGDIDLLTEVALPNQQAMADKAKDRITLLHQTYGGAAQGWFVPSYAVAPGGAAAGLTSVTQLNQFASAFGGKLYDADPGWVTTAQNKKRLAGYGLHLTQVASSEAAELAELKRAYDAKKPIVVYLYHPHWVFSRYQLTQLAEPTPYSDGCLTTGSGACAMPAYSAWTAASTDLAAKAPKFVALLKHLEIALPDMEAMLAKVDVDKQPADAVAQQWVTDHTAQVSAWLTNG